MSWSWANTLTVITLVISSGALVMSICNGWHHPKPKIVADWWDRISSPPDDAPCTLGVSVWNHGNAAASDVKLRVSTISDAALHDLQKIMSSNTPRRNPVRTDAERELDRIRKESLRRSKEKQSPLL